MLIAHYALCAQQAHVVFSHHAYHLQEHLSILSYLKLLLFLSSLVNNPCLSHCLCTLNLIVASLLVSDLPYTPHKPSCFIMKKVKSSYVSPAPQLSRWPQ